MDAADSFRGLTDSLWFVEGTDAPVFVSDDVFEMMQDRRRSRPEAGSSTTVMPVSSVKASTA